MTDERPIGWHEIDDIVKSNINDFGDGTPFFDHLDADLTHSYFFETLVRNVQNDMARLGNYHRGYLPAIAVSGKFGWAFGQWLKRERKIVADLIVFPGDLRHQELIDPHLHEPLAPEYVFLDNSTYKGRTMNQIEKYLDEYRSRLGTRYVLYDGAVPDQQLIRRYELNHIYQWHESGYRESYENLV